MRGGEGEKNGPFVVFCNDDDDGGVGDGGERERARGHKESTLLGRVALFTIVLTACF